MRPLMGSLVTVLQYTLQPHQASRKTISIKSEKDLKSLEPQAVNLKLEDEILQYFR